MFDRDPAAWGWLAELNAPQRAAVLHGDGPLLILAGAGTGKTATLAARVARLLADGVAPPRILLLTFTRRAADELRRRAELMAARTGADAGQHSGKVVGGTFHAVANRLLRRHGDVLGLGCDFGVLDQSDAADLIDLVRDDLGAATGRRRFPRKGTLAAVYSRMVNAREKVGDVIAREHPWAVDHTDTIAEVLRGYVARKRARRLLDYDDLLLWWRALLDVPGIGDEVGQAFDHVLVDEYQDTNALQAEILSALRRSNRNLTVVGDDAQAIYAFRAATVENILGFPDRFPGATVIALEQSYRSTQGILDVANAVIAEAPEQWDKALWSQLPPGPRPRLHTCSDEAEQSDRVCDAVLAAREEGLELRDQAVLVRTGHHTAHLELELARRGIPFVKYGGLKFLEAAHVKDVLAVLRILDNPFDEVAWFRVLQLAGGRRPARRPQAHGRAGPGRHRPRRAGRSSPTSRPRWRACSPRRRRSRWPRARSSAAWSTRSLTAAPARRSRSSWSASAAGTRPSARASTATPRCGCQTSSSSRWSRAPRPTGAASSTTSSWTRRPRPATSPVRRCSTRTGWCSRPSTPPRAWSGSACTSCTAPTATSRPTWPPAPTPRSPRSAACSTSRSPAPSASLDVYAPLRYHHDRLGTGDRHSWGQLSRFLTGAARPLLEPVGPAYPLTRDVPVPAAGRAAAHAIDALLDDLLG